MKVKPTVSIFIPAYNEEANIAYLLVSILRQKEFFYKLENIYVVDDGSTDQTANLALKLSQNYSNIHLLSGGKRLGKIDRLNQIYKQNESDILVLFDADFLLDSPYVVDQMIRKFTDPKVAVVGCNKIPAIPNTLVEKLVNTWFFTLYEIRKDINQGDNIHNFSSGAFALRDTFAKTLYYPPDIYPITKFTYFAALKQKLKVKFAVDAHVLFRSPNNIYDYLLQITRFQHVTKLNARYYGNWIYQVCHIPLQKSIRTILKVFVKNPFYTSLAVLLRLSLFFIPPKTAKDKIWTTVESSKKLANEKIVRPLN